MKYIGWSVSLLILIPLFYPLALSETLFKRQGLNRHGLNISFIFLCGVLHLYILLSRLYAFASPKISRTILTTSEWAFLDETCHKPGTKLSDQERNVSAIIFFVGSPIMLLLALYKLVSTTIKRNTKSKHFPFSMSCRKWIRILLYFAVLPVIAVTQVWSILRLQKEQKAMADFIGSEYSDNTWSFGQIIAVLIWAPVIVEYLYLYLSMLHANLES